MENFLRQILEHKLIHWIQFRKTDKYTWEYEVPGSRILQSMNNLVQWNDKYLNLNEVYNVELFNKVASEYFLILFA